MKSVTILSVLLSLTAAKIVFKEEFDDSWHDRWVESTHKSDFGKWELTAGKFYGDAKKDRGIKTTQDAHFYATAAKFPESFSNEGKTLVVQFSAKHEQKIDCGGGYVKVMASTADLKDFHGETPYNIMFGPDICGHSSKKVHVIFNHKGKNLLTKKEIKCKDDVLSHLYTLVVKPDNTYEVYIDQERVEGGNLEDDWDFLAPKKIKDPAAKKPEDWDDREEIDDPEDTKPADYDKPQYIPDPNAKKPEDWDDEMDGAWEPPQIDNPEFKGEWKPKKIKNPKYSGVWVHPEIDNPEYVADSSLYKYSDFGAIGFDLWQVKSGTIFDNVLVAVGEGTEAIDEARVHGKETWAAGRDNEKKMKEEQDKKEEEEKKKREEEDKKRREEEDAKKKEDDADKADAEKAEEESEHAHHDHDHGEL